MKISKYGKMYFGEHAAEYESWHKKVWLCLEIFFIKEATSSQ